MQLHEFDTLAQAQAYTENKERMISQDMIVSFLTQYDSISTLQSATDEKAKGFWLAVSSGVKEFNVMNSHPVGQAQQSLLSYMASIGAVTTDFQVACMAYANYQTQPYVNTTQEEFDAAKFTPVKTEVTYLEGMTYIITTGNQGVDVQLTNISVDGDFELYLDTCADSADQHQDTSYIPYAGGVAVVRVTSKNGVAQFSLSNRKVRQYNRLYVKALHDCTFDALAVTNRG